MENIKGINSANGPLTDKSREKLRKATDEFEEIFVSMMLKEMYKNIGKTGFLDGGKHEEMFRDMLIEQRAKDLAKNADFGLGEQMFEQFQKLLNAQTLPDQSIKPNNLEELYHQGQIDKIAHSFKNSKGRSK